MSDPDLKHSRRPKPNAQYGMDRLPPHSPECEQGILGCILLDANASMGECIENLDGSEVFYDLRHQTIYGTMVEMFDNREVIDLITLQQKLKDGQMLDEVGGITYLSHLTDTVPSASNLSYYIGIVRDKYHLRRMIQVCTNAVSSIYECEADAASLLDAIEGDVMKASQLRARKVSGSIKDLIRTAISEIEDTWKRQGEISGIKTGFPDLDRDTDGLQNGDMIVIAARPSQGKTSLAMNIAESVCVDSRLPVGVFSLEMTATALAKRLLLSRARVSMRVVRDGYLAERDFPKLTSAAGKIASAPLYIDDSSGISILQLRAKARRMSQQYGIKMLVIDYLQLLQGSKSRAENRQQEITEISCGVKSLAKELNVPVIVLSQLNRELDKDKGRRPRLSDIRESGSVEQDADLVAFLWRKPRPEDEYEDSSHSDAIPVTLLIAKQRNGVAPVEIPLTFLKSITRFESAARVSDEDIPQ